MAAPLIELLRALAPFLQAASAQFSLSLSTPWRSYPLLGVPLLVHLPCANHGAWRPGPKPRSPLWRAKLALLRATCSPWSFSPLPSPNPSQPSSSLPSSISRRYVCSVP
ncbi:hypothetical protein ZEAMMB73_Zm00001d037705 [Zea mays]|uniref:Secreted protein n=1 Tax=Zea mays TaxID=4577 RepID=A0A1D6LZZ7_MAIZE|nr:hypothetical protein ZEAMMB73_Zm00001d037705 [Zea mays]